MCDLSRFHFSSNKILTSSRSYQKRLHVTCWLKTPKLKTPYLKRGCVFPMVIWPAFRMEQYRVNDHPYHAPQFIVLLNVATSADWPKKTNVRLSDLMNPTIFSFKFIFYFLWQFCPIYFLYIEFSESKLQYYMDKLSKAVPWRESDEDLPDVFLLQSNRKLSGLNFQV